MRYKSLGKTGIRVSVLGLGCMRFPELENGHVDEHKAALIIKRAMERGINYFDTAYIYHNEESEALLGRALAEYDRQSYKIATKLPVWKVADYEDMERILQVQLNRLDRDFIDCYLLHGLDKYSWKKMKELDVFSFLDKALEQKKIKYIGFSFHDDVDTFKEIVDGYTWDFCQIQYNYLDENYQAGREGLEYAAGKNLGVVIMEPLRGGLLSTNMPGPASEIFESSVYKKSPASWALNWIWNQKAVTTVLSGMSTIGQLDENADCAESSGNNMMSEEELSVIEKVKDFYKSLEKVKCTNCRYCMPCPKNVNIPAIFSVYNSAFIFNNDPLKAKEAYYVRIKEQERAVNCVNCGKCEEKCPQHIHIMALLQKIAAFFGHSKN